jgi:hypothetical protein
MGRKQRGTIATKELKYAALAAWLQFGWCSLAPLPIINTMVSELAKR